MRGPREFWANLKLWGDRERDPDAKWYAHLPAAPVLGATEPAIKCGLKTKEIVFPNVQELWRAGFNACEDCHPPASFTGMRAVSQVSDLFAPPRK
jgi:hypothetical protein